MVATPEVVVKPQDTPAYGVPGQTIDVGNRIDWLDGLRALAALAVVIVHAFEMFGLGLGAFWGVEKDQSGMAGTPAGEIFYLTYELFVGQFVWAVELFIVLSGFSLMLPLMRGADRSLRGGALRFFQRRARRILPPYYAALLIGILLILIVPGMSEPSGSYDYRDLMIPLTPGAVISHLFLVHNASQMWDLKIVPPMWSIAVEYQIYFLFPLLVLLWQRIGAIRTLVIALLFGTLQGFLQPRLGWPTFPLSQAWFVGLFALGMAAAAVSFSGDKRARLLRERVPWLSIGAVIFGAMLVLKVLLRNSGGVPHWFGDTLLGLSAMCLLIYLVRTSGDKKGLLARVLSLRPLVKVGHFSYSLYLIHTPIMAVLSIALTALGVSALAAHLLMLAIGVPMAVGGAYLFFLAFERPFLSTVARKHAMA